ncbi:MAG: C25 family cysteine peptidase [Petrotogales bacterium]
MKKTIPIFIIGILILSSFGAVGITGDTISGVTSKMSTLSFTPPVFREEGENYLTVELMEGEYYLMDPGKPMIPKIIESVELPFGVRNIRVEVTPKNVREYTISKQILPSPTPIPLTTLQGEIGVNTNNICFNHKPKDDAIYTSEKVYPSAWYDYAAGCGLNHNMKRVTHLSIYLFPVRYIPSQNKLLFAEKADIKITYEDPQVNSLPEITEKDLVIIAPSKFSDDLQPLINHKNTFGISTIFKTTEEIYDEYDKIDKPESIKYFIKDAIETHNISYVLLVGGLKSIIYAKPRDHKNHGTKGWHLPVRYSNLGIKHGGEPGYLCDLYYADIYKEGGLFDNWDSNGNGIFAEFDPIGGDKLDLYPDVALGRLACRNSGEVKAVVDKIITYEQSTCDPSWFRKIVGVTGDGFMDQEDLNIIWDTKDLDLGEYTIYAQSYNDEDEFGPIDEINITLDRTQETTLTFNHDDHLQIEDYPNYPYPPIAEIVSVSDGDILGSTDYTYDPSEGEAYCDDHTGWAQVEFINGVLHIRGKSYDPKLYGNITNIHVWIKNSDGEKVFDAWRNNTKMFSEGDWTVGEKMLHGRAGAFYYMPEDFEKVFLSTANGQWTGMSDVIDAISEGCGFLFFSGHGSPNVWMDHFPGIPGNRQNADALGLKVSSIKPFRPFIEFPIFPMEKLTNDYELPVAVVGGCHNSMFNVSAIPAMLHVLYILTKGKINNWMHTYGSCVPESFSWYLVKMPKKGAIASIGNTGYGYGILGEWCTTGGVDNWITTEFFRQFGTEGRQVLGEAYSQTLTNYIDTFGKGDAGHVKTVEQWVLLGDPSLMMGGYT